MHAAEPHTAADAAPSARESKQRSGWFAAAGLLGALAASSCCIVPLLLVTFGVSGAWIGNLTALEPFKPYVAGLAVAAIALGFRHAYFRRQQACNVDGYCARPGASMLIRSVLWLATVVVLLAITIDWWAPLFHQEVRVKRVALIVAAGAVVTSLSGAALPVGSPASAVRAAAAQTVSDATVTLAVENMTCALCPLTVRTAMAKVEGVKSVTVDFDAKTATVIYDPRAATPESIAAASTNAGYPARPAG